MAIWSSSSPTGWEEDDTTDPPQGFRSRFNFVHGLIRKLLCQDFAREVDLYCCLLPKEYEDKEKTKMCAANPAVAFIEGGYFWATAEFRWPVVHPPLEPGTRVVFTLVLAQRKYGPDPKRIAKDIFLYSKPIA